jgi:hypothetical protein
MDENSVVRNPNSAPDRYPNREDVARLAHRYYEERGYLHGYHEDDWHRAEGELRGSRQPEESATRGDSARTVVAMFHSIADARRAFDELQKETFSADEVSFIANKSSASGLEDSAAENGDAGLHHGKEIGSDAGIGAAVGGVGGLLLSLAGLAVPGIGPVLAAGPIIAALGGAGLGAAAGGLIGALAEKGVPEEMAAHYMEGVRRGDVLIIVQASGERADRAAEILDRNGAVDIDDRVTEWRRRGWSGPQANVEPLTDEEIRREREYIRLADEQAKEWRRASRTY